MGRLGLDGILNDYGEPMRKMAFDGAPLPAPAEVTLDTSEALREIERRKLRELIPNIFRL